METCRSIQRTTTEKSHKHAATEDEFWKKEMEWRAQQAADMKVKNERLRVERLEREKVRKQRALENFVEPYTDEIILCDQLISYMQKISPETEDGVEASSECKQKTEVLASAGFGDILVSKKNRKDEDLELWFSGSGGGKKGGKKSKSSGPQKNKLKEKISLSLDALSSFQKIKVLAPSTCGKVPKKIQEIQTQKDLYLQMQRKAQESREKGEKETGDLSPEEEALVGGPQISLKKGSSTKQDGSSSNGVLNLNEAMFPPLHIACNGNSIVAIGAEKHGNPDLVNGTLSESFENDVNISESGDEGKTEIEIIQDLGDEAKLEVLPDSVDVAKVEIQPDLEYPSQARFVESKTGGNCGSPWAWDQFLKGHLFDPGSFQNLGFSSKAHRSR